MILKYKEFTLIVAISQVQRICIDHCDISCLFSCCLEACHTMQTLIAFYWEEQKWCRMQTTLYWWLPSLTVECTAVKAAQCTPVGSSFNPGQEGSTRALLTWEGRNVQCKGYRNEAKYSICMSWLCVTLCYNFWHLTDRCSVHVYSRTVWVVVCALQSCG